MGKKVLIIGGGAIGLFSAYYLRREGHEVIVADKGDFSDNCSYGNAGLIVPSHIVPLASPGMMLTAVKYLFDPSAPVAVKMPPTIEFLQWALGFARAANKRHVQRSSYILKELSLLSKSLYNELLNNGLSFQLDKKGLLIICGSTSTQKEESASARLANDVGIEARILSKDEVLNMEPVLANHIKGGVYYAGDCSLAPTQLMKNLIAALENSGVSFLKNATVKSIKERADRTVYAVINDESFLFDDLVISAGVWSNDLLKMIGKKVPLQPGRGYSFDVPNRAISYPSLLIDERVSVTPFSDGTLRFGGGMELGYFNTNIFRKRLEKICEAARFYYPAMKHLKSSNLKVWQGHRPCSFDGLPYIGRVPGFRSIYLATGHSMMGITLAPATGKLISELVGEAQLSVDLSPFRVER